MPVPLWPIYNVVVFCGRRVCADVAAGCYDPPGPHLIVSKA